MLQHCRDESDCSQLLLGSGWNKDVSQHHVLRKTRKKFILPNIKLSRGHDRQRSEYEEHWALAVIGGEVEDFMHSL